MAVLEGNTKRYIGDSAEARPVPGTASMPEGESLPAGSSWFSRDTFEIERWDGKSWNRAPRNTEILAMLGMMLDVLREQNELLMAMKDRI